MRPCWLPCRQAHRRCRQRLVRHGHLPEREIVTGIGPVAVRCPRVRDRGGEGSARIRFSSAILPPYARRSKSLEVPIPILYLKRLYRRLRGGARRFAWQGCRRTLGLDHRPAQGRLVGRARALEQTRSFGQALRLLLVDGIHVQARLEDDAQCLLVIIGATPEGKKELVGLIDGVRESTQSWRSCSSISSGVGL